MSGMGGSFSELEWQMLALATAHINNLYLLFDRVDQVQGNLLSAEEVADRFPLLSKREGRFWCSRISVSPRLNLHEAFDRPGVLLAESLHEQIVSLERLLARQGQVLVISLRDLFPCNILTINEHKPGMSDIEVGRSLGVRGVISAERLLCNLSGNPIL
jgi:hypothetical protein